MKPTLVDDARSLYKRWSVQFAVLAALILQELAANPQPAIEFFSTIEPEWVRRVIVFALCSGVPILLTALKQKSRGAPAEDTAQ